MTPPDIVGPSGSSRRRYRLLVVCTANQCRSPLGEHLWGRHLRAEGILATMRSAGTAAVDASTATTAAIAAASELGIDLRTHRAQRIGPWIDLADVIVTATNAQLREVVALDRRLWPRTFTVADLVQRGEAEPRQREIGLSVWLDQIGSTRQRIDFMGDGVHGEIFDPTGGSLRQHLDTAAQLDLLLRRLTSAAFGAEDGAGRP